MTVKEKIKTVKHNSGKRLTSETIRQRHIDRLKQKSKCGGIIGAEARSQLAAIRKQERRQRKANT